MSKATRFLLVVILSLVPGTVLYSEDYSQHFISAKPGMVNYVEGAPSLFSGDQDQGSKLAARQQLKAGDRLQTQANDRVELLLSPGSYLRIAGDSQVQVLQNSFEDMHFSLTQGTAILEAAAFDKKVNSMTMSLPSGDLKILENGLYRFQVTPNQPVEVFVYSGKAKWLKNEKEITTLKPKKRYLLESTEQGKPQFVKLDNENMDSLDLWSKRRAEYLVSANDRLSPWMFDSAFNGYYNYGLGYRGGWVFNPFFGAFTFVPFNEYGFLSPYGYSYGYYYPMYGYGGYPRGGGGSSSSSGQSGNVSATSSKPRNTTVQQRSSASSSASSSNSRMSTGRSDQGSRSGTQGSGRSSGTQGSARQR
jgi:hypothetical protein